MEPKAITAKAIQDTVLAALRILSVLIGGLTVLFGLVAKRDLAGLIVWVQSNDFLIFAGAATSAIAFAWGLWKTYDRSHRLNSVSPPAGPSPAPPVIKALLPFLVFGPLALALAGCATVGSSVRLNTDKAFLTAQIALLSAQQSTLALCSLPAHPAQCDKAVDILAKGAEAERVGFAAQQAGNASGLAAAVQALSTVPSDLVALGVLKAN